MHILVDWLAHNLPRPAPGVESFRLIKADGQEVRCARGAGGEAGDLFKLALGGSLGGSIAIVNICQAMESVGNQCNL